MAIENGQTSNNTRMTVKAAAKKKKKETSRLVNELLVICRIADDGQLQYDYRHTEMCTHIKFHKHMKFVALWMAHLKKKLSVENTYSHN